MKKVAAVLAAAVLVVSLVSMVFAAESVKGKIKSMDASANTMVISSKGGSEEVTLKVDKSVDLGAWKTGDIVNVEVEDGTAMSVKKMKRAPVGC